MDSGIKGKTISGFFWRFMERCGAQGVNFVVTIVLARLLAPKLYGTIALVTVFTAILQIFVDSGMGNALIQKKDSDDVDFSSVFYFNITMCSILYIGMFFSAPLIAEFYQRPELVPVVRVMSLTLVISGVKNIQQAYVSKHMLFKKFFFSTLGGTIAAAIVGISMAYAGFGVWALVAQDLTNKCIDTIVLWITVKWRPRLLFSWERLKGLISYGWKLLVSGLIDTVYNNVRQLIIGKMYTPEDLGLFNKGQQLPTTIVNNINTSIDSVLFPAMSSQQDSRERVKSMTRRSIKVSSYIMWPLMLGLSFTATTIISLLMTDKWLGAVVYLRVFCITYAFYPIHTANLNAIKAMGRSDIYMKLEIMKKGFGLATMLVTMFISVKAMAYSLLLVSVVSQIINAWPNRKLLGYSYWEQIKDILPAIIVSLIACICIVPLNFMAIPKIIKLTVQVVIAASVYIGISKVFKMEAFRYICSTAKEFKKKA